MSTPEVFSVSFTPRARKEAHRLDPQILRRVAAAIDELTQNPRPSGCLKVKTGDQLWRIRVGDWRIGYEVDDAAREITIITIGHRREFYD